MRIRYAALLIIVALTGVINILGCGDRQNRAKYEIAKVDLKRGNILLCGDGQFGKVNFNLGCDPATRATFDLGLSLLHSFEYSEAEKAFVQVLDNDPGCTMAYWGVAMSNFHPLWEAPNKAELEKGSKVLQIARELPSSDHDRAYIDAIAAFYDHWQELDHRTRTLRFEEQMARLHNQYPDEVEAAVFYALALNAAADPADKSYTNQRKAGELLESLFPEQPDHPGIAHYIIHNYDSPELAELALPTARKYSQIAPASAHAQHMPSHIFTRLGLWEESIQSNLNSTSSAVCYAQSFDADGHWDEELHGMDYLVYAYLQVGNNKEARAQYDYLKSFRKVFPANFKVAYTAAAVPSRLAMENKNWQEAAELELPLATEIPWDDFPWQRSLLHYSRAMGAIHLGELQRAEEELERIEQWQDDLIRQQDQYKANQLQIEITIIKAWMELKKGRDRQALELMKLAADMESKTTKHPVTPGEILPAEELLGDMLLSTGRSAEALLAYEADLKTHPNRFNGIYGAALAASRIGETAKASGYFQLLLKNASGTGSQRKELEEARAYLGSHML